MSNKIEDNGTKANTFATKLGNIIATLFVCCLTACIATILIALTCKFIMWIL